MANIARTAGRVENPQTINWGRAAKTTVLTGTVLATLYALSQIWPTSNEEIQETGSSLVLRSVGQLTTDAFQFFSGLAAFGLPFALVQPAPIPDLGVAVDERLDEELMYMPREAVVMASSIQNYLETGKVPIDNFTGSAESLVAHFISQAESMQYPADRTVCYNIARRFINQVEEDFPADREVCYDIDKYFAHWRKEREELCLKEAQAGYEAANRAEAPEEKLIWLARAGAILNLPLERLSYNEDSPYFSGLNEGKQREFARLAASIWQEAGELLLANDKIPVEIFMALPFMSHRQARVRELAIARSFRYSGHALSLGENEEESTRMFQKAYDFLKRIDLESRTFGEDDLRREIIEVSLAFLKKPH